MGNIHGQGLGHQQGQSDVKTNFMTFSYSEENVIGNYTLDSASTTAATSAAGLAGSQSVQLSYEPRQDTEMGYQSRLGGQSQQAGD